MTNFALEDVGIHTASLLADVVLSDAVAHDIAGWFEPVVAENAVGQSSLGLNLFFRTIFFFFHNLILQEVLNRIRTDSIDGICSWAGWANSDRLLQVLDCVLKEWVAQLYGYFVYQRLMQGQIREDLIKQVEFVGKVRVCEYFIRVSEYRRAKAGICCLME